MLNFSKRFIVQHIEKEGTLKDLLDSFRLRFEIFCREKGFLSAEDYPKSHEYDCFDHLSHHIVVRDPESAELLGTVRLVRYSREFGLPTAHHFPDLYAKLADIPLTQTYEISRLCISETYRQGFVPKEGHYRFVLLSMIKKIYHTVTALEGNYLIATMEAGMIRYLSMFGIEPIRLSDKCIEFYGQVTPCVIYIDTLLERISQKRPELYDFFMNDDHKKAAPLTLAVRAPSCVNY
jgi:N-acyl amino acid synthase of PEP-CTERM/exosortase system